MGEQRLRALAVRLAAEDAAAGRHAHHDRAGELAVRAVAQARRFRDDLVVGRVDVVGELDFDARPQPVGGHADRRADDAGFVDRRVEAARSCRISACRPCVQRNTPPKIADILAEDDDVLVALHRHVHGVADRLDHGHARHGSDPRLLALAPQMRRHLGIDVFEHVARRRLAAGMQRAVALGFLLRRDHRVEDLGLGLRVALVRPDAALRSDGSSAGSTGSPSGQASDSVFGR